MSIITHYITVVNGLFESIRERHTQSALAKEFRTFITQKQDTAKNLAGSFVPKTALGIWVRNTVRNFLDTKLVARFFWRKYLVDHLALKKYE